jgi:DNA-binding NarL/FixJ family response regulator
MFSSHRMVLSEFGDPRTVLRELLRGWIWDVHHGGAQTPGELLKGVRHCLDKVRKKSSRGARSPRQSQGQSSQRSRRKQQPKALETWEVQEAIRLDVNTLKESAKLSAKQSLVWELKQQGWKNREIAARRGVTVGTVKQETNRIKKKLADARNRCFFH